MTIDTAAERERIGDRYCPECDGFAIAEGYLDEIDRLNADLRAEQLAVNALRLRNKQCEEQILKLYDELEDRRNL